MCKGGRGAPPFPFFGWLLTFWRPDRRGRGGVKIWLLTFWARVKFDFWLFSPPKSTKKCLFWLIFTTFCQISSIYYHIWPLFDQLFDYVVDIWLLTLIFFGSPPFPFSPPPFPSQFDFFWPAGRGRGGDKFDFWLFGISKSARTCTPVLTTLNFSCPKIQFSIHLIFKPFFHVFRSNSTKNACRHWRQAKNS